jgi:hypothetical protein
MNPTFNFSIIFFIRIVTHEKLAYVLLLLSEKSTIDRESKGTACTTHPPLKKSESSSSKESGNPMQFPVLPSQNGPNRQRVVTQVDSYAVRQHKPIGFEHK